MLLRSEGRQAGGRAGIGTAVPAPALRCGVEQPETGAEGLSGRARPGDCAEVGELYLQYGAMVHGVLLARVGRAEAEDLTQDVFLLACRKLGEVREGSAIGGWLVSIARNRASDWARANGRRRGHEERAARGVTRGAEREAEARADAVLAAIRRLPEAYREPLALRLVAGLTGPQIACCLGMTHGSVRVNLHRGMAMLRAELSEDRR